MPNLEAPKELTYFDLDRAPFIEKDDSLEVNEALELVNRSFIAWETERRNSHDTRWQDAKDLYAGKVIQRYWDNSRKYPKSAVSIRTVYDQVTTAYPNLVTALFGKTPWFDVVNANDPLAAEAKRQRLCYVLETPNKDGITAVTHLKKSLRNHFLVYGTAFGQVGWDSETLEPFVVHLDPRDVYLPPGGGVTVDSAPAWILRKEIPISELKRLKSETFKLPGDAVLNYLAQNRSTDAGAETRDLAEALRGINVTSGQHAVNPVDDKVEVHIYETRERIIWVLGRKWVAYNEENPFGLLTLVGAPYSDDGESRYGEGVPDLIGAEQKLQQAVTNAAIDEVSLQLNPPIAQRKQMSQKPDANVYRPGQKYEITGEEKIELLAPSRAITGDAFALIGLSDQRAQRRTGMNAMSQQGTPTPSNANRTASGVSQQAAAVSLRLLEPIQNFEDLFLIPMLYKLDRIMSIMDTREVAPGRDQQGNGTQVPTAQAYGPGEFKLFGATRLRAREAIAPFFMPILQFYLNPELVKSIQPMGKTVDYLEINRLVEDTFDIGERYNIVRDMTPQEQQAAQQGSEMAAEAQAKMMELQTRVQIAQQNNQTKLEAEKIKAEGKANESAEKNATSLAAELLKMKEKSKPDAKGAK